VDDPCTTLRGTQDVRERAITGVILLWRALGFSLVFRKGERGTDVTWIGNQLQLDSEGVRISLKQDILDEVREMIDTFRAKNVISLKDLRSFAGKCNHIAGVVPMWRPFLREIWAAIAYCLRGDAEATRAPPNTVWTKQLASTLDWLEAFLLGTTGALSVRFELASFVGCDSRVRITTDASP